jgi:hypothetical protein
MAVIYLHGEPVLVCGGCGTEAPRQTWAKAAVCGRCWEWLRDQMLLRQARLRRELAAADRSTP